MKQLGLVVGAVLATLVAPVTAQAAISVERVSLTPVDARAAVHTRVDLHAEFSTADPLRSLALHLPPGLVGNPLAVPRCARERFASGTCPASTRVGSARVTTALLLAGELSGGVYNLEPEGGEPARLGMALAPAMPATTQRIVVRLALRPDGGIDAVTGDIPSEAGAVRSLDLSFGGAVAPAFITLPTSCRPATTTVEAVAASGARGSASTTFTPFACDRVPFAPALGALVERHGPRRAPGNPPVTAALVVPAGHAAIQRVQVTLPARLGLDLTRVAPGVVGGATAATPVLTRPLAGPIELVQRPGTLLPGLRLTLAGPVRLSYLGTLELTSAGLATTFDGLPDLPLRRLELHFNGGGPLKALGNPCRGRPLRMAVSIAGHNGVSRNQRTRVRVRGCPPAATVRLRHGRMRVTLRRGRDAARIRRVAILLPRGLRTGSGRRAVSVRLEHARAKVTLRLRVRGRPHGRRVRITVTGSDGRRAVVRRKARALR
jgi:hypothetical protein